MACQISESEMQMIEQTKHGREADLIMYIDYLTMQCTHLVQRP